MIRRPPRSTPLSLHDALPICARRREAPPPRGRVEPVAGDLPRQPRRALAQQREDRSEEHTSELQSQSNLVCRLLLEKKKRQETTYSSPTTAPQWTRYDRHTHR